MIEERRSRYELFLEEEARKAQPTKRCKICGVVKTISEYRKQSIGKLGVETQCKECAKKSERKFKNDEDRFWKTYHSKTIKVGECLEWTGLVHSDGNSPRCKWQKTNTTVRRVMWILLYGGISDDMFIVTTCKNKRCVKQSHLKLISANEMKMVRSNASSDAAIGDNNPLRRYPERRAYGVRNARYHGPERIGKLTEEKVQQIRNEYAMGGISTRELSIQYDVDRSVICRIIRREAWKHVQ